MAGWERVRWLDAEPMVLDRERSTMATLAPELRWREEDPAGGWEGNAPIWPFARPKPAQLDQFLAGRRLRIRVDYSQAHPMEEPQIWPLDPEPSIVCRRDQRWHVMGDGSLCLFQSADAWDPHATAADLVVKAAGWFLEYLLMQADLIKKMTVRGIAVDDSLDGLFVPRAVSE